MSLAVLQIRIWYPVLFWSLDLGSRLDKISGFWIRDLGSAVYILGHTYFLEAVWRIRDVYPGSWFLPIPDLGSRIQKQQQKTGLKQVFCHTTFYPKICHLALKHMGLGSGIRDSGSGIRKKTFFRKPFFVDTNFTTLNIILFLIWWRKLWPNFPRVSEFFTQKIVTKPSNMGLGSGIQKKPIPEPGSRGQKGTGSRIRIRNTA